MKIVSLHLAGCFSLVGWTKLQSWTALNLETNPVHLTLFQVVKSVTRTLLKARCTWRQINPQVPWINAMRFHTATITILRLFICQPALFLLIASHHKLDCTLVPGRASPLPCFSAKGALPSSLVQWSQRCRALSLQDSACCSYYGNFDALRCPHLFSFLPSILDAVISSI